ITAFFPSIALDDSGSSHVSYLFMQGGRVRGALRYAVKSGGTWKIETVASDGDTGFDTSIAVGPSGQVHISYVCYPGPGDLSSSILRYATRTGVVGPWTI